MQEPGPTQRTGDDLPLPAAEILEAAPQAIVCIDLEGRLLFANRLAATMLGCSAAADLIGQPIRTYIQFFGTTSPSRDHICWREDGTSFPIEYEVAPLTEDGSAVGTIVTFRDISQRQASDQLKDEMISVVSHELRTPLTSIRTVLGLLAGGFVVDLPPTGQRLLDIAVSNSDRLIRLLNDMLDLERLSSGQIDISVVACDAGDLMLQAADGVRVLAEQAGVQLHLLPKTASVWADPDRLLQVLTNLLANAIKFSPPDGGMVWLEVQHFDGEVVFRVRDEGRGIPPEKLETIFERFTQVADSDAREKKGSGLGLAISRAIVEQHGGQIWAESTLGAGTTVCVALPSAPADLRSQSDDDEQDDEQVEAAA